MYRQRRAVQIKWRAYRTYESATYFSTRSFSVQGALTIFSVYSPTVRFVFVDSFFSIPIDIDLKVFTPYRRQSCCKQRCYWFPGGRRSVRSEVEHLVREFIENSMSRMKDEKMSQIYNTKGAAMIMAKSWPDVDVFFSLPNLT